MARVQPLTLNSTMVHEIPRGRMRDGGPSLTLSKTPTVLNAETDRFIREEMLSPLENGREIVYADSDKSPVPRLVNEILADNAKLPDHSREIAQHLHKVQWASASPGVVLASLATERGNAGRRFIILKAEHQEGVRLGHTGSNDDATFVAEHLTELIMGQNSQVFKIGMFWHNPDNRLVGLMVDRQNGASFADYFLEEFLGCSLTYSAEKQMQSFVRALDKFVNDPTLSVEKRTRYATAAVAMLESPADRIRPSQFITEFLDPEDRDDFQHSLPGDISNVDFRKDTTLVQAQIGGLRMRMNSGVVISAGPDKWRDGTVKVVTDGEDGPRVIVKGTPDDLSFGKPPKS